jgi:hypothetical protein
MNDKHQLDKIVEILKNKIDYNETDYFYDITCQFLTIRGVVVVEWSNKDQKYILSFAVNADILGSVVLVHQLHKNNIHNITFRESFYISTLNVNDGEDPKVYYGHEANVQYMKEILIHSKKHNFDFESDDIMINETIH